MCLSILSTYTEKSYEFLYEKLSLLANSDSRFDIDVKLEDICYKESKGVAKIG